ncbi:tape measure protein [Corynebacterium sp.]|uniref:tape measure protein n=1 Tax=Corynebacterium sp. TaxID=1720 RepID=UPI0025BBEFC9|nr:tape measure protein [Corynebacterium sp.]
MSSVWVPILPSLKGFTQKIEGEARSASQRGGKVATEEFGKAGEASGRSLADGLKRQQALVSAASKTLGDARTAEANAAGAVKTAELELQRLRERGDASASKIAKAEEDVADKKRKAETASERLTRAEQEHATVRDGGEASSRKLISAEDRVVDARNKVEKATGEVRVADLRVIEAREKSETRAAALQSAEDNLASVRAEFGEDSKQAAAAERQVEAARKQAETAARGVIDTETALAKKKGELQTANEGVAAATLSHKAVQEDLAASERAAGEEADRAAQDIRGLGDEMNGAEDPAHGLAGGLGSLAKNAGLAAAAFVGVRGIGDTISAGFDKVTAIEDTTASLGILMGSADEAADLMDDLTESNMKTPYSFDAWSEAGKNLVAFGMDASDVTDTVMALGEAAAASGKGEQALASMGDAFGKAAASGKISMDLINSLSAGGVNGLTILANEFDVTTAEMQKMISAGTVPVEQAFEALTTGIMEGSDGIAGSTMAMTGVMDEMSQTTSGQLGLLKMSFVNLGGDIMKLAMPAIKQFASAGSDLIGVVRGLISGFVEGEGVMGAFRSVLETIAPILKPIAAAAITTGAAIGGLTLANAAYSTASALSTKATDAFRGSLDLLKGHPIVAAIAAVVGALTWFFTSTETGQRVWDSLMDSLKSAWSWLKDTFAPVFDWIGEKLSLLGGAFSELWGMISGDEMAGGWPNLAELIGLDKAEWIFDIVGRIGGAFRELWEMVTGGDLADGWGNLAGLIGLDNAEWVFDTINRLRDAFGTVLDVLKQIPELASGVWNILFNGDYTGLPFGLEEDSAIVDFLFTLRDTAIEVGGFLRDTLGGALSSLWGALQDVGPALLEVGQALGGSLLDAAIGVWDAISGLWDGVTKLWEVLSPLLLPVLKVVGGVLGGLVLGAIMGVAKGLQFVAKAVEIAAGVFSWLVENALSPLISVGGEVARIFGTVLGTAFSALGTIVEGVWTGIQWGWENLVKPAFDALVEAGKILFAIVGTAVLGPLLVAWNLLSAGIQWGWENHIQPAWENLQNVALWMWENVLQPVFGWIRTGWELLSAGIQWYYENVILVAWNALQTAAIWLWENVLQPVFGWIRAGWEAMSTGIQWVYDTIIKPTWDALGTALNWLNDFVVQPVLGWIQDRWDQMGTAIQWVKDHVIQPVFDSIATGLDVLKGVFETAVSGIEKVWDGLRAAAAKPVKFVIDKVWNDGILKAWNLIADFVPGLDPVDPYEPDWLGDYHTGTSSIVPGARSVGRDNMDFVSTDGRYGISLAGQEGIAHQHVVDGIGRSNWDHLNHVGRTRGASAVREELGSFATGGVIGNDYLDREDLGSYAQGGTLQMNPGVDVTTDIQRAMISAVAKAFPNQIVTSATRYEDVGSGYDNHMAGRAVDFAPDQGLANWIAKEYPGSAELFWDPGPNLKNGAPTGAIGGHSDHVHWAMASMPDPYTGEIISQDGPGGGGGGGGNWLYNKAKDVWDSTVGKIGDWIRDSTASWGDSKFAEMPSKIYDETEQKVFNWIMDKVPFASGPGGGEAIDWDTSAGAEQWRPQVISALARHGYGEELADITLQQVDIESTGDPNAFNDWDENAAIGDPTVGLLQVRQATYDMIRGMYPDAFEGLPNDRYHPESNLTAGIGWTRYKYGGPANIWPTRAGYDQGGWLEPMEGAQAVYNHTSEPEPVLTGQQWRDVKGNLDFALAAAPSAESWARIADELTAAFNGNTGMFDELADILGADHAEQLVTDVAAIRGSIEDELLDFFGLSNTWMADPSLLDISWEAPGAVDNGIDHDDHDPEPDDTSDGPDDDFMADPAAGVAAVNDSLVGDVPATSASQASASEVTPGNDRVTLDRDMVVNIVMENVTTSDPNEIARETAREARRALAAFRF